ncbi:MAG: beta-glucosidase [Solirubrobacteraceae bacterium]
MARFARRLAAALAVLAVVPASAPAAGRCGSHPWCDTSLSPDVRAGLLLGALTRDERISLLAGDEVFGVAGGAGRHTGTSDGVARLDLPTTYYSDGPAGTRQGPSTALPAPIALAATFDTALAREHGAIVGDEAKKKGNEVVFAPTVNIMRTPLGGRTFEGYGEDPFLVSRLGVAWIEGAQAQGVIGDVKHFALNNQEGEGASVPGAPVGAGAQGSRMTVDVNLDERTLREIYLPQFEAAVKEAHVGSVMCSYNRVGGQYACENRRLLTDILKNEWGFGGYVLADYGASHGTAASLANGLDFEPWPGIAYGPVPVGAALATSQATDAQVDEHVRRILRTAFAFGLFDRAAYADDDSAIDKPGNDAVARDIETAGTVLLRNRAHVLPLDAAKLGKVAVIGADAARYKNGGGSSNVTPYTTVTPLQGIQARAGAGRVAYDDGSDAARAAALAKGSDAAIVVVADQSSEGTDKPCLGLNCGQADTLDRDALIAQVAAAQPRTIVVMETGGPVLTPWRDKVAALLEAWYPGQAGGTAIARVLFGDADPGGRLPATFPAAADDEPTAGDPEKYPGVAEEVSYKEGVLVGYRWWDARRIAPAYPFGYGLSYTTFRLSRRRIARRAGGRVVVSASLTNTGRRTGTAVPQLYLALPAPNPTTPQPPRQLKGFAKVALRPGRSRRVSFALGRRAFSYYDVPAKGWRVAPGCYGVQVGTSSRDLPLRGAIARGAPRTHRTCSARRARHARRTRR